MACPEVLAVGEVFLVLLGCADFLMLALYEMNNMLCLSSAPLQPTGDNFQDCSGSSLGFTKPDCDCRQSYDHLICPVTCKTHMMCNISTSYWATQTLKSSKNRIQSVASLLVFYKPKTGQVPFIVAYCLHISIRFCYF
jgi:hypothetical protein